MNRTWAFAAVAAAVTIGAGAAAAGTWTEAATGAVANLPAPAKPTSIRSAQLECDQQRWLLRLDLDADATGGKALRPASLEIGRARFDLTAESDGPSAIVRLHHEVLAPIRNGLRMQLSLGEADTAISAVFSLIGSRKAIDAVAPRCSRRDMSAYRLVEPLETNPEIGIAGELLSEEIRAFREATRATPAIAAQIVDLGETGSLLFATLCGSSWYYGASGCNLTVHASSGEPAQWRRVYETQGMAVHLDPRSNASWPNLVTLDADGEEITWQWQDGVYHPVFEDAVSSLADESEGG